MRRRLVIAIVQIGLAVAGIAVLVRPIRDMGGSSDFHKGQVFGVALIALALLSAAIPWGRPPRNPREEAGEL